MKLMGSLFRLLRLIINVYVHDKWKVDLWWMRNPAIRSYYRLTTEEGVFMTVFKDMLKERWYSQRY